MCYTPAPLGSTGPIGPNGPLGPYGANVSTVAITVGGAAMVSALVLWLTTEPWSTEPNRSEQAISVFPRFGGDEVGVGMSATF